MPLTRGINVQLSTRRERMAYTEKNYRTKKELKEAVAKGDVPVQPGLLGYDANDGNVVIEGPQFPEPHKWYAGVTVVNGVIPKGSRVK
jgi:hypothetical protein